MWLPARPTGSPTVRRFSEATQVRPSGTPGSPIAFLFVPQLRFDVTPPCAAGRRLPQVETFPYEKCVAGRGRSTPSTKMSTFSL